MDQFLPILDSLLPNSALLDESTASELAIQRVEQLSTVQFLNLTTFLISNNFPGEASSENIYKWIKENGSNDVFDALSSMQDLTAKALLENLFRLAIEAEDIPTVKGLLKAGVNPNGHNCRIKPIPDTLTPMQFACIARNSELAQELIKAGSTIDEPGSRWKSSALVLAIIGQNFRPGMGERGHLELLEKNDSNNGNSDDGLIGLVDSLIEAGASINLADLDPYNETGSFTEDDWDGNDRNEPPCLDGLDELEDGHSPLTAASKYRYQSLVDLLIQKGADVNFVTKRRTTSLQECLYSWEEMKFNVVVYGSPVSLLGRRPFFRGSHEESKINGVVRSLLAAGANSSRPTLYRFISPYNNNDNNVTYSATLSPIDLAVYTEVFEVVEMLLCGGANVTEHSLEVSIKIQSHDIFDRLLRTNVSVPKRIMQIMPQKKIYRGDSLRWIEMILERRRDFQTKRAAMIAAIRLGFVSIIDSLINSENFNSGPVLVGSHELAAAIEECCTYRHIEVLRHILDRNFKYRSVVVPWLRRSLYAAIWNNDLEMVNNLIEAGADVNAMTSNYQTALLAAIWQGNKDIIGRLLKARAALNTKGNRCRNYPRHTEFSGAVLITAIYLEGSIDEEVLEDLIEAGANVNAPGSAGIPFTRDCTCITPLTAAIKWRDLKFVKRLIDKGAAVNDPPGSRLTCTPLAAAVDRHDIPLIRLLLGMGANPEDAQALENATDNAALLELLLQPLRSRKELRNNSNVGRRAVDKAMQQQDTTVVKTILDGQLVDLNSIQGGFSVLCNALIYDTSPDLEVIKILLSSGSNPNGVPRESFESAYSPLTVAIDTGNHSKLELLLQAGAHPDLVTPKIEFLPLQMAVYKEARTMVQILLNHGADPDAASTYGECGTPLQLATELKNVEMVKLLLDYKANPNSVANKMIHTALQMAARDGCKEIVEILLKNGADVNSPAAKSAGATALQFAAMGGFLGLAYLLLEYGADINAAPAEIRGRTALEGAAEHGRIDMVQLLLNAGANIYNSGQQRYESALRLASKNGHHATRQLLETYHG